MLGFISILGVKLYTTGKNFFIFMLRGLANILKETPLYSEFQLFLISITCLLILMNIVSKIGVLKDFRDIFGY